MYKCAYCKTSYKTIIERAECEIKCEEKHKRKIKEEEYKKLEQQRKELEAKELLRFKPYMDKYYRVIFKGSNNDIKKSKYYIKPNRFSLNGNCGLAQLTVIKILYDEQGNVTNGYMFDKDGDIDFFENKREKTIIEPISKEEYYSAGQDYLKYLLEIASFHPDTQWASHISPIYD